MNVNSSRVFVEQQTDYPWSGSVAIKVKPDESNQLIVKLRIPLWAQNKVVPGSLYSYKDAKNGKILVSINGKQAQYNLESDYIVITRRWEKGDIIILNFPMSIRRVVANEKVRENNNLSALEYGPLVYCVEGIDNNNQIEDITVSTTATLRAEMRKGFLGGVVVITGNAQTKKGKGKTNLTAIPYFAWANRGAGTMKVWLPEK